MRGRRCSLAAVALLAWNPYNAVRPGLPALVRGGGGDLHGRAADRPRALEYAPLPRGLRMGVAVSLGCSLVTAPILWLEFGYLPILGVPANALAEPAMPVLLGLAFLTAALDTVSPGAAAVVAWLNGWTAAYIAFCARAIGSLPFAEITSDAAARDPARPRARGRVRVLPQAAATWPAAPETRVRETRIRRRRSRVRRGHERNDEPPDSEARVASPRPERPRRGTSARRDRTRRRERRDAVHRDARRRLRGAAARRT